MVTTRAHRATSPHLPSDADRSPKILDDYALTRIEQSHRQHRPGRGRHLLLRQHPGEAGDQSINTIVNATDEIAARNFQHSAVDPALIDDPYDYNRDGLVNGTDQIIARNNQTNPLTMLRLITVDAAIKQSVMEDHDAAEALSAALDWQWGAVYLWRSPCRRPSVLVDVYGVEIEISGHQGGTP